MIICNMQSAELTRVTVSFKKSYEFKYERHLFDKAILVMQMFMGIPTESIEVLRYTNDGECDVECTVPNDEIHLLKQFEWVLQKAMQISNRPELPEEYWPWRIDLLENVCVGMSEDKEIYAKYGTATRDINQKIMKDGEPDSESIAEAMYTALDWIENRHFIQ